MCFTFYRLHKTQFIVLCVCVFLCYFFSVLSWFFSVAPVEQYPLCLNTKQIQIDVIANEKEEHALIKLEQCFSSNKCCPAKYARQNESMRKKNL